jgi:hypothetical protein
MTDADRAALALMVPCGFCWAAPSTACGHEGQHLARYLRAYRRGLISRRALTMICQALPHISDGQVIGEITALSR